LLKDNEDDPIREEDAEDQKVKEFPTETRVNGDGEDGDNEKDVGKIQEHETTEMKEEEEEKNTKKEEDKDKCLT